MIGTNGSNVLCGASDDTLRGGTHDKTTDGARDVIDCGAGTDTVYYTPGVDVVGGDCGSLNPSE